MRVTLLSVVAAAFILVGCGSNKTNKNTPNACAASSVLGSFSGYVADGSDTISFNADCTGASTYCGSTFQFQPTKGNQGVLTMNASSSSNAMGCPAQGNQQVQFTFDGTNLTLTYPSAGGMSNSYTKQ